ncbi:MAG: DUF3179 domain-containing protein [Phaeodactylibacter sp.]|nr:DUF3179 domain-containing protein [Phaeodactylibacter sp.]
MMLLFCACNRGADLELPPNSSGNGQPPETQISTHDCRIPLEQIHEGGPGVDGIPSIDLPDFTPIEQVTFLGDLESVLVLQQAGTTKIYPHQILDYHEIVNDAIGEFRFSTTYCPLTGTGMAWGRSLADGVTTFGVSGLLHNNNLMPYDRSTGSLWSQLRMDCVSGTWAGTAAEVFNLLETSFLTATQLFPEALVLNTNTGYNRAYGLYPYGDYRSNHESIFFPLDRPDNRLPNKQKVLLIDLGTAQKAVTFPEAAGPDLQQTIIGGRSILIYRNTEMPLIAAYEVAAGDNYTLSPVGTSYLFQDESGRQFDVFGQSADGSVMLPRPLQFLGYWFAIASTYPNVPIL